MKRLEGKVAVGGGEASAGRRRESSHRRPKQKNTEAVKTMGNGVVALQGDVAKLTDVDRLYAEVPQKLGKIDVRFVNAGVAKFEPLAFARPSPSSAAFPVKKSGRLLQLLFRGLLSLHSRYGLYVRGVA
jgi:NAD(P)-dependent dehydrogenase (short-subunit alcohol dehydrogenase family)